jgi:hypothetical protein
VAQATDSVDRACMPGMQSVLRLITAFPSADRAPSGRIVAGTVLERELLVACRALQRGGAAGRAGRDGRGNISPLASEALSQDLIKAIDLSERK